MYMYTVYTVYSIRHSNLFEFSTAVWHFVSSEKGQRTFCKLSNRQPLLASQVCPPAATVCHAHQIELEWLVQLLAPILGCIK